MTIHEEKVSKSEYPDRWSKDLIAGSSGFSIGVAKYHATEFGALQVHEDQEALYVVSGVGEILIGDEVHAMYRFKNGATGYFDSVRRAGAPRPWRYGLRIFGTNAGVRTSP